MLLTDSKILRAGITCLAVAASPWKIPYLTRRVPMHRLFVQVTSLNSMSGILEDALREYNETYATMDLVLFEDAMKHVRSQLRCAYICLFHIADDICCSQ